MKYIETKEEKETILSMVLNEEEWEYIGGFDEIQDGMGGTEGEKWYKNIQNNDGIVINYNDTNTDVVIRTMEALEFEEYYNRYDGMYLINKGITKVKKL